jgi:hypothetical protein
MEVPFVVARVLVLMAVEQAWFHHDGSTSHWTSVAGFDAANAGALLR